jgi:tRNA-dihydrouridine synthase C
MHNWIQKDRPALVLAPMEGVTDAPMRALLTERGGFSFCVAEFQRVGHEPIPEHVWRSHIPELATYCETSAGTPIQVQILGGDEEMMAQAAVRATELGARAIDINFGCPSKTVNRHDGGAALLRYPDRIYGITKAVREAVDRKYPVSVKMRLGWDEKNDIFRNAEKACEAGASWLTIHARTKTQGYAPPAYWAYIGEVRKHIDIPIIGNGEIWSVDDFERCREQTGCTHFMIGRGALANPRLPIEIARRLGLSNGDDQNIFELHEWGPLLRRFSELNLPAVKRGPEVVVGRMKQWLKFAHLRQPIAWFDDVKQTKTLEQFFDVVSAQGQTRNS